MNVKSIYEENFFNNPNHAVIHLGEELNMKDLSVAAEFISSITSRNSKSTKWQK